MLKLLLPLAQHLIIAIHFKIGIHSLTQQVRFVYFFGTLNARSESKMIISATEEQPMQREDSIESSGRTDAVAAACCVAHTSYTNMSGVEFRAAAAATATASILRGIEDDE